MTYRCSKDMTLLNAKSSTVDMVGVYLQCPGLKNAPLQGVVLFIYLSFTKLHQSINIEQCT